mgnify:CR=1 FL=1
MKQKFTILFDLDGTLVDTAPDLIRAHNHVMKKFGYPTKTLGELKNAVGKGAKAMMAKANGQWRWFDEKIKNEMTDEFLSYYGKNILHFGGGQTEAVLSLSPGKYVLQLALGDYEHTPVKPKNVSANDLPLVSEKISIEITSD